MTARPVIGDPPVNRWEIENGRRRAERLAGAAAGLIRAGAVSPELSLALLPQLRALSDRQCGMLERELEAAFAVRPDE
jgi:hypothetical protein